MTFILAGLNNSTLFKDVSEDDLKSLEPIFHEKLVSEGKTVFVENMPGESLYVIVKGTVKISKMLSEGDENILVTLGPGEVFGEMAVLDATPRSATARVVDDAKLLYIRKAAFETLCSENPVLGLKLVINIIKSFSNKIRQNNEDFKQMLLWCQDRKE